MAEGGVASFSSGSDVIFDFFCELCIDDNKQVEAEGYCVDCREYLCELCFTAHKRTRSTRHHELKDKSNMPQDTPLSTDRVSKDISTKCKVHSDKPVEYYCKSHAVLGCANCFVTDHKHCADVESIAQTSENIFQSQWCKDFISNLQLLQNRSVDIEARARENKTVSRTCCNDVVSMVRKLKEEAIVMLNEIEQNTVTLAENMMSEDEEKMENVEDDCKVLSKQIEQLSSRFETVLSSKRACQLYINMREAESDVKSIHKNIGKLEEANVVRTFTFVPNSGQASTLRSPDILGTISLQYQQARTPSPAIARDPSSITATKLDDINVISHSDTYSCGITGSAVVSSNRLVITDRHNSTVKLLDTHTNKLLSELKLSSKPCDIAAINRTQAAVTLQDSSKILIMEVSPSLTVKREITMRGNCHGVACSQDILLVTFVDNPRLEIIDLHGNVSRTIEKGRDGSKLFIRPGYVCVSRDGETIYVSDSNNSTVTSLSCDGVVKAVYKDEELRCSQKVCTDNDGNVYVCGFLSKNVHMITADCKKTKVILKQADGLYNYVYSVSHCQDTNRLFIGMTWDNVKVFQLS